jgi:DNA-binding CsgD family transcriptional regulator
MHLLSLTPIHGRDRERRYLAGLGADLTTGPGLVLAGEPGIGKSALMDAAELETAWPGVHALAMIVVPGHRDRPLSALDEILALLHESRPGRADAPGELAATAFSAAAARRPTALLIDNAQYMDDLSWDAVTHAARRLHEEPFAVIAALPDGHPRIRDGGLPSLVLGPLEHDAAAAVLQDVGGDELPTFVRDRILESSGGNPLALRELGAATAEQWRVRCVRPPSALPLTPRLVQAFAAPVEELSLVTQEVVLAAAANDSEQLSEAVSVAAATLGISTEEALTACLPAFERRIVDSDSTTLRFRSEAARSAIYQSASLPRRHAVHTAFARLLADVPHRAAWHRAAASLQPDEALARELESAGRAHRGRGQVRTALAVMDRAVRVSQDPAARVQRLLDAAELSFEIGRPDFVAQFVGQAAGLADSAPQRRGVAQMQSLYDLWRPDNGNGLRELLEQAERAAADGNDVGVRTVVARIIEKISIEPVTRLPRAELVAFVDRLGGPAAHPALVGVLATAAPAERGLEALEALGASSSDGDGDPRLARVLAEAALALGDDELAIGRFSASIDRLRGDGRLGMLPFALLDRARVLTGASLDLARRDADEGARLARETDQLILLGRLRAVQSLIAGLAGDLVTARERADEAARMALDRPALLVDVHVARGLTALATAEYDDAYRLLGHVWDDTAPALAVSRRWAVIGELVEAAVFSGHADDVRPHVDRLAVIAARVPSPALRAGVDYAQALLADDAQADAAFRAARESAGPRGLLASGRVQLAYGNWLRRQRQITRARTELRSALSTFEALGAVGWADRARHELRAAGAAVASAAPPAAADLTPRERQIAELAASGLSNREIGQRMYLSHRTISTHLYRIFPKLGVTTRAQLRDALTYAQAQAQAAAA